MSLSRRIAAPRRRLENRIRHLVGLPQRRKHAYVEFFISRGNAVNLYLSDVHQNRNEATAHMLLEAMKTTKYHLRQDKRLILCTDDRPRAMTSRCCATRRVRTCATASRCPTSRSGTGPMSG